MKNARIFVTFNCFKTFDFFHIENIRVTENMLANLATRIFLNAFNVNNKTGYGRKTHIFYIRVSGNYLTMLMMMSALLDYFKLSPRERGMKDTDQSGITVLL